MSDRPGADELAEELRRFIVSAKQWGKGIKPAPEQLETHDCGWCPVCQLTAALRDDHPEISERITIAGAALVNAARSFVDAAAQAAEDAKAARPRPRPKAAEPEVQRIKLDGDETV